MDGLIARKTSENIFSPVETIGKSLGELVLVSEKPAERTSEVIKKNSAELFWPCTRHLSERPLFVFECKYMWCYSVLCRDTEVLLINLAFSRMSNASRLGVNLVALKLVRDGPCASACGPLCCCVTPGSSGRAGQHGAGGVDSRPLDLCCSSAWCKHVSSEGC